MSNKTTVETVSITDIKAGDTILDGDGERIVVETIDHQLLTSPLGLPRRGRVWPFGPLGLCSARRAG